MTKKHQQPLIDGTLLGPDHLAELVAYHLHRLGAAQAELVVFASDGARWIWDRLDWIEQRAGLDPSRTVCVLDFCHAAHHISLALESLGWDEKRRRETYGRLRKLLKASRWEAVVDELIKWAHSQPKNRDIWTEIRYLNSHGQEGHLNYVTCRIWLRVVFFAAIRAGGGKQTHSAHHRRPDLCGQEPLPRAERSSVE